MIKLSKSNIYFNITIYELKYYFYYSIKTEVGLVI